MVVVMVMAMVMLVAMAMVMVAAMAMVMATVMVMVIAMAMTMAMPTVVGEHLLSLLDAESGQCFEDDLVMCCDPFNRGAVSVIEEINERQETTDVYGRSTIPLTIVTLVKR